ncbi:MAG: hypothetical protein ACRDSZ_13000 [Pseudonocardiaceae bacterium]
MTSPPHPSVAVLGQIDWDATTSILHGCTRLFDTLASDPTVLATLVAGVAYDPHLARPRERSGP